MELPIHPTPTLPQVMKLQRPVEDPRNKFREPVSPHEVADGFFTDPASCTWWKVEVHLVRAEAGAELAFDFVDEVVVEVCDAGGDSFEAV